MINPSETLLDLRRNRRSAMPPRPMPSIVSASSLDPPAVIFTARSLNVVLEHLSRTDKIKSHSAPLGD